MAADVALILGVAMLLGAAPATGPSGAALLQQGRDALGRQETRQAIELLSRPLETPAFAHDPAAPAVLMLLGEAAERHVKGVNDRYWQRSRLDPRSPTWLRRVRGEQEWAARHAATFSYFEPRGRYRYEGDAYRLLVRRFARHPLAEEATWRLIPCEDDGEHRVAVDPALLDASRHERFLRRFPRSRHRLAARLAIGWDYLYASGFTWGPPDRARFAKGQRILEAIVREAPRSSEAREAGAMLRRAHDPFGPNDPRAGRRAGS